MNTMFRYRVVIGHRLHARNSQDREVAIAGNTMNRMTALGRPESSSIDT